MKETDLFRQCAKEAVRWSSRKSASADERRALINLACRYAQAALIGDGDVLGASFVPPPVTRCQRRLTLSFDLFMDDTCPKCRKPLRLAAIEPHTTRPNLVVHSFECAHCGAVKTKILMRKQGKDAA